MVDSAWGGLYRGGTYLLVGERKSGKTLLSLQFATEAAKNKEVSLYFTNSRPKDLMFHAASIDVDLEKYISTNSIIIVKVATPPENNNGFDNDAIFADYLKDIISVVKQYSPSRIIFDEITPYINFENLIQLKEVFGEMVEKIEDMGITSLFLLREPVAQSAKMIFDIINSFATGVIQLHKEEKEDYRKTGIIDITPNIGHTEGRFKANYFIQPNVGISTDFKQSNNGNAVINNVVNNQQNQKTPAKITSPEFLIPNLYSVNDFKLILNNQLALFKTTGQTFSLVCIKFNPRNLFNPSLTFNQMNNAVLLSAGKKDKICPIGDRIFVLLTNSDQESVVNFKNKVIQQLAANDIQEIKFFLLNADQKFNSADDLLNEIDLDVARSRLEHS